MKVTHQLGFEIEFPDNWHINHDPNPDIALVGVAQPDEFGFSRNVTVSVGSADDYGETMHVWHEQTLEVLFAALDNAQLIDVNVDTDSFRRVISYVAGSRVVVLEQWVQLWKTPDRTLGVTISATTPTLDFPTYAEEMNDIAWSWQEVSGAK
ncbi:MAG: hypothetical protein ACTJFR_02515 [Canibacter sp.]